MSNTHEQIRSHIAAGARHDEQAREHRRAAGALLRIARCEDPNGTSWYQRAGLDKRLAELLHAMATDELYEKARRAHI